MKPPVAALFRSIAEYTYDWETWVDASGVARWINPAVERVTGYRVDECLALDGYPLALALDEDKPLLARVLSDARAGGSGNDVEFRVRCKDGAPRWVAISWQALRGEHDERLGYRTSIRDIEQRKQIEAELHVMRRRAEDAVAARTQLLANVSHELRSPVHCIAGFSELLLESELSTEQRRYLELIARECGGMLRHVEDLLQLAAIEAGGARLLPRPFELGELVAGVVEAARPNADARGLKLKLSCAASTWLHGDPLRIGQVLRNLLDNALKFTAEGEVRVSVSARGARQKDVALVVEDTGIGIDPTQIERLLAPFEQANERRTQGVGLGLSIVQRLVQSMRGTLHIDSKPGEGTRVRVNLPLATARPEPAAKAQPTPRAKKRASALVVDDSAPARELLTVMLSRAGYRVTEAASGQEALTRFAQAPTELVLLDYQMPDADGIETALSLRRLASASPTKPRIFLLTANVFARARIVEGAIDGILEKPVSRATLLSLLDARPEDEGFDARVIEDLREVQAGSVTLFDKLLASTSEAMKSELRALSRAAKANDRVELANTAHRIAGHTAILGARGIADRARKLENAAARAQFATLQKEAEQLRREWPRVERALREAR